MGNTLVKYTGRMFSTQYCAVKVFLNIVVNTVSVLHHPKHVVSTVNSLEHTVNGLIHTVNGLKHTVNGMRFTVNGLHHTVDGKAHTVNGMQHTIKASHFVSSVFNTPLAVCLTHR